MTGPVDVLIIGAGASGAAVAWSLAETKMHILCLEQGDWMKPSEYPSTARYWEARQLNDFHSSPNRRARDTDYPINDADSPIKIANFNGVGGGTVLYAGHFPRFYPSDFRRARWTASPMTGRSTTRPWSRSTPRTTGDGRVRLGRRSRLSAA
jgi:choline dehydrogenase-like flavoprotein